MGVPSQIIASLHARPPGVTDCHVAGSDEEATTMLATRIPKSLHRSIRLHCVTRDMLMMDFVTAAITEHLKREPRPRAKRSSSRTAQ